MVQGKDDESSDILIKDLAAKDSKAAVNAFCVLLEVHGMSIELCLSKVQIIRHDFFYS